MNMNYHLTEAEAKDGLNGLLPKKNKSAMQIAGLFAGITGGLVLYNLVVGLSWRHIFFAIACAILAGWFFMNRSISVSAIGRRAGGKEYMITVSPDGWVRTGKEGEKISFSKDAFAVETPLTVSFRPDDKHMYVVPKSSMSDSRSAELMDLLDQVHCPVQRQQ